MPKYLYVPYHLARLLLGGLCLLALTACSNSANSNKTSELQPQPNTSSSSPPRSLLAQATPPPTSVVENAAPKTEEINKAMARVFNHAAMVDSTRTSPFIVGDFNGDGSKDIAIVTKANPDSLADINNELANWTLEDMKETNLPDPTARPKRVRVDKGDPLLAIIHGVGPQGWRNPEARQTFLIKNGVGTNPSVESIKQMQNAPPNSKIPELRGDVIRETINGRHGVIYWTGARYAWLPTTE